MTVIGGPDYYPYYYYDDIDPSWYVDDAPAPVAGDVLDAPPTQVVANQAAPPRSTSSDIITIGVPNAKGGFTSVKLVKCPGGYIGPQGEFYAGHPTVEQLKVLYGG